MDSTWKPQPTFYRVRMVTERSLVRILPSARKHGIPDAAIRKSMLLPIATLQLSLDPLKVMVLGHTRDNELIEIIYVMNDDGSKVVIHAMLATRAFRNRVIREWGA